MKNLEYYQKKKKNTRKFFNKELELPNKNDVIKK